MHPILQIVLAVVVANFYEWAIHKYLLHGLGKNKKSFWHFHWHHHKAVRRCEGFDPVFLSGHYWKEIFSLFFFGFVHVPLFWVLPYTAGTMMAYAVLYYMVHRYAHQKVSWALKWLPWHYEHHMGNQDKNWCIVMPLWDYILRTRKNYNVSMESMDKNFSRSKKAKRTEALLQKSFRKK